MEKSIYALKESILLGIGFGDLSKTAKTSKRLKKIKISRRIPVSEQRFGPGIFRIRSRNANISTTVFCYSLFVFCKAEKYCSF
jgi:hypothetical protein